MKIKELLEVINEKQPIMIDWPAANTFIRHMSKSEIGLGWYDEDIVDIRTNNCIGVIELVIEV